MRPDVVVLADAAAVAAEAAARIVEAAKAAELSIALSGGSTPKAVHRLLSGPHVADVDWSRVSIFFGDERCVPPEHADSNFRMAKESLLDPLAALGHAPRAIARIEGELAPAEAAARYATRLAALARGRFPVLDLVLLGMGPDGHTASMFPGTSVLGERSLAVSTVSAERTLPPHVDRVTLTYPTLNAARAILVLVTGAEKATSLALAVDGAPGAVPLRDVRPTAGSMTILCDRAAAAQLGT